jgi:hypothetical protein
MPGASDTGEFQGNRVLVTGETKGRLSPVAEKFWQCAKEAASKNSSLSVLWILD